MVVLLTMPLASQQWWKKPAGGRTSQPEGRRRMWRWWQGE
jgi:hypothetical protein